MQSGGDIPPGCNMFGQLSSVGLMPNTEQRAAQEECGGSAWESPRETGVDCRSGLLRANMFLAPVAVELLVNSVYGQPEVEAQTVE